VVAVGGEGEMPWIVVVGPWGTVVVGIVEVVDVVGIVEVVVVVDVSMVTATCPRSWEPRDLGWSNTRYDEPESAFSMNRRKMSAGTVPPVTCGTP
jgi:hypothetical protein